MTSPKDDDGGTHGGSFSLKESHRTNSTTEEEPPKPSPGTYSLMNTSTSSSFELLSSPSIGQNDASLDPEQEEDLKLKIRRQLANTSGFLYRPDYKHANLRTQPPCETPEKLPYDLRKEAEDKKSKKKAATKDATAPKADTPSDDPSPPNVVRTRKKPALKIDSSLATGDVIKPADYDTRSKAAKKRARQKANKKTREAVEEDDNELEDDTVITAGQSLAHLKLGDQYATNMSSMLIPPENVHRSVSTRSKASTGSAVTAICGHSGTNTLRSDSLDADTEERSNSPVKFIKPPKPSSSETSSEPDDPTTAIRHNFDAHLQDGFTQLLSSELVHPWPEIWEKHLTTAEDLPALKLKGGFKKPTLPSDPQNRIAYDRIYNMLVRCWMVATGQKYANDEVATILAPMLEKDIASDRSSGSDWAMVASPVGSPVGTPHSSFPPFPQYSESPLVSSPLVNSPHDRNSTGTSFSGSSSHSPHIGGGSFGQSPYVGTPQQSSTCISRPDTPSKRTRIASFGSSVFGKSPKKSPGSSYTEQLPFDDDVPPVPPVPASFSGSTQLHAHTFTPVPAPQQPTLRHKPSASSDSKASKTSSTKRSSHSRTSSAVTVDYSVFDAHLSSLVENFKAWQESGTETSFPLPALAVNVARCVLTAANKAFEPKIDVKRDMHNLELRRARVQWMLDNKGRRKSKCPFPEPAPMSEAYLRAGYEAAWAVRFLEWAEEQEELKKYVEEDAPARAGGAAGQGLWRPGRTAELKARLNWAEEVGDAGRELAPAEAEKRFAELVAEYGDDARWAACEEQVARLEVLLLKR